VETAPPLVNLRGEAVALGPFPPDRADAVARWYNDYAVMRNWEFLPGPRTAAALRPAFEPGGFFDQAENTVFAVYEAASWELVGMTGLVHVDHVNRTAEFLIMIGEARHRGRGYGTEATRLLLDHAFLGLGLANVLLRVFEYNLAGIRAYEKAGFRRIGVRRRSKLMGGRLWDTVLMEAVAEGFASPVLGGVLVPDRPRGG
jgi:RimJ/RimL family protein N-acetyltransferase